MKEKLVREYGKALELIWNTLQKGEPINYFQQQYLLAVLKAEAEKRNTSPEVRGR